METFETKFAAFLKFVEKESDLELTDELVDTLREGLIKSKFDQVGGSVVIRKKRLNGYNLFMRERMAVLKETLTDSNKRMSKISEEWNDLDELHKNDWKERAKKVSSGPIKIRVKAKKPNKPPKLSGYQVFVSEKMETLKDIKPKERMTEIGKLWSKQSDDEKADFKRKATARNELALIKFTAEAVKVEVKEPVKVEVKEPVKVEAKEPVKVEAKEPVKVEAK